MHTASVKTADIRPTPLRGPAAAGHAMRDVAPRVASLLPGVISRGAATDRHGARMLYLTFDDGPTPGLTSRLLETLAAHQAQATFFVLGSRAARTPTMVRAVSDAGHAVGNHGWSHVDAWRERGGVDDLRRGQAWLEDFTGRRVDDTRPPYGHLTPSTYAWALAGRRRLVLWDCMPGDFLASIPTHQLISLLVRRVRPGSIVVLHDGEDGGRAEAVLSDALPRLRDAGWRFATL